VNRHFIIMAIIMALLPWNIAVCASRDSVEARAKKEEEIPPNYFAIAFHRPTYILPWYYTGSPDNAVYSGNTPNNEKLKNSEVKYQFSVKVPVWQHIFNHDSSLYLAYTQLSYWQLYNHNSFFRESDYEPEIFLSNELRKSFGKWRLDFFNIGASHQSNGYGNALERSWNRLYVEATSSVGNWMISVKPWLILSTNNNNNNIGQFMGYGQILVGYKYNKQLFSLMYYGIRKPSAMLSWSFPLLPWVKGYVQVFSGYGQSLIEYNHHTTSAGIGIAFADWV